MKTEKSEKSTKDRLLDTAERLYAEKGIQATSLREITRKARANLAAVNYHFRSKDALTRAVFERRLTPINRERIRLLDEAERTAGGGPLQVEAVLHAFFDPTIHLWEEGRHFVRLSGRLEYEPDEKLHHFFLSQFEEVILRFDAAMCRALPEVPRKELYWRMHFLVGGMVHTWISAHDIERVSGGLCALENYKELVERLVHFGAAGLRSPVPAQERSS